jgi:hypothetical protein
MGRVTQFCQRNSWQGSRFLDFYVAFDSNASASKLKCSATNDEHEV